MKQKKKNMNGPKEITRDYFNPYEVTTPRRQSERSRSNLERTYGSKNRSSSVQQAASTSHVKNKVRDISTGQKQSIARQKSSKNASHIKKSSNIHKRPEASSKVGTTSRTLSPEQRRQQMKKPPKKLSRTQRMQMKRKRQFQFLCRVVIAMVVTVGLVWGGILLKEALTRPMVSIQTVMEGSLDTSTSFEGIVLRNEKVISGEESGNARYIIAEGDKVNKEGIVYVLVDEENLASTTNAQEEVDDEIYHEAEERTMVSDQLDQRYNLDQQVKNQFNEFYLNRFDRRISNIYALRSQLDSNISSRTNLYTAEQENHNEDLVQKKQALNENLKNYQKGKAVAESGIVSYRMDGYEKEDAKAAIEALTYKEYVHYRKAPSVVSLAPNVISKDAPIFKLVLNNEWYVVTYINSKEDQWTVGQSYPLNFDDVGNKTIAFSLVSKKEDESHTQLVFKSNNQIGSFLGARSVNFSIGDKKTTGLKIPIQAIVELNLIKIPIVYCVSENNVEGVYRKKGEITEFVPLTYQSKGNEMNSILQDLTNAMTLQLNDIIVDPKTGETYQVTESEVSKGVYVVNGQVANFKAVEVLASNNDYALVKNNAKSELKEMDKIISNPKSIKMGQLLEDMKVQNE